MYYYSEVLRGMRALRVIAIILGIFLALAIILRLWAFSEHNPEAVASALQASPTAHVTTKTLADGTIETTVNDPMKQVHAVIERRGQFFHMDVTLPATYSLSSERFLAIGNLSVDRSRRGGMSRVVVTREGSGSANDIGIGILFAISCVIGLVTATMLGGVLAKENDGHLELAWTKPVSRERLAIASIAADMVTIVVSQLAMFALTLIIVLMFVWPHLYANALTPWVIGLAVLAPLAWYACLTAFSASLKRGLGLVCGLGWLVALMVPSIAGATAYSDSDLGRTVHTVFQSIAYVDPIAYVSFHGSVGAGGMQMQTAGGTIEFSVLMLLVLTIVYATLAVLQWRRVEA
jgi:ABC-type transport system involved in multi-copper enzyme maturation permease subunit